MNINLSGQAILVTGASRGIGKAVAEALGAAGARVAVHYNRNAEPAIALAASLGNGSQAFQADLEQPEACSGLMAAVIASFGKVDCLINNAGIAEMSPLEAETDWIASWQRTMAVNLTAVGILSRAALMHFRERKSGRFIHISSRAAFRGDTPEYLAYASSKGGLVALSRSLARYFGKEGIVSFLLAPGFVRTDMAQDFVDEYGEEYVLNDLALNKLTEPADLAPMCVLLASGLSDHATGCTIDINAGSYVH